MSLRPDLASRSRLRLMTCGAVDDGKSTLMGRLLHGCGAVYDDQLNEVRRASGATTDDALDLAFLVDGLKMEREQGITIDVAYRYFATERRAFLLADAPGHEQYTRNQAAAASQADVAIVVVSVEEGMRPQTRRHMAIAALFGVRSMLVVINKMDAAGFAEAPFLRVAGEVRAFAASLGAEVIDCIPVSATGGDNVVEGSRRMAWHGGGTVLERLETVETRTETQAALRLPVQVTGRIAGGGRVSLGAIASGSIAVGDRVAADPAFPAEVTGLWQAGVPVASAGPGAAVAVELAPDVDIGRGAVLAPASAPARPALRLVARLVWIGSGPLVAGRDHDCLIATSRAGASVSSVRGVIDLATAEADRARKDVAPNDIAEVLLTLSAPIVAAPFKESRTFGSFILVDRASRATIAAGVVVEVDRWADDLPWQSNEVTPAARAGLMRQTPHVLWFTGLSGAGKSTIAELLDRRLHALGRHTVVLDGDNLRHGLTADLGFSDGDRVENMRRVAHVAKLMADAGMIVIVSLISPFAAERGRARELIGPERFVEIFVDAPIEVCRTRDPKGHYARAAAGSLAQFTGVSAGYEPPEAPDVHLRTDTESPIELVDRLLAELRMRRLLEG